jgi:hypothetical protein
VHGDSGSTCVNGGQEPRLFGGEDAVLESLVFQAPSLPTVRRMVPHLNFGALTLGSRCGAARMSPTDFVSRGSFASRQFHVSDGLCGTQHTTKNQQLGDEDSDGHCFPRSARLLNEENNVRRSERMSVGRLSQRGNGVTCNGRTAL